jgi:hypothetical protein
LEKSLEDPFSLLFDVKCSFIKGVSFEAKDMERVRECYLNVIVIGMEKYCISKESKHLLFSFCFFVK